MPQLLELFRFPRHIPQAWTGKPQRSRQLPNTPIPRNEAIQRAFPPNAKAFGSEADTLICRVNSRPREDRKVTPLGVRLCSEKITTLAGRPAPSVAGLTRIIHEA